MTTGAGVVVDLAAVDRGKVYWFHFANGSVRGRLVRVRRDGCQLHGDPLPWRTVEIQRRRFSEVHPWGSVECRSSAAFLCAEPVPDVPNDPPGRRCPEEYRR